MYCSLFVYWLSWLEPVSLWLTIQPDRSAKPWTYIYIYIYNFYYIFFLFYFLYAPLCATATWAIFCINYLLWSDHSMNYAACFRIMMALNFSSSCCCDGTAGWLSVVPPRLSDQSMPFAATLTVASHLGRRRRRSLYCRLNVRMVS